VPANTPTVILDLPGTTINDRFAGILFVRDNAGTQRQAQVFFSKTADGANANMLTNVTTQDYTITTSGGTQILLEQASQRTVRVTVLYFVKGTL
jgi:hypothetical protein